MENKNVFFLFQSEIFFIALATRRISNDEEGKKKQFLFTIWDYGCWEIRFFLKQLYDLYL
jgi:hypothetical protein